MVYQSSAQPGQAALVDQFADQPNLFRSLVALADCLVGWLVCHRPNGGPGSGALDGSLIYRCPSVTRCQNALADRLACEPSGFHRKGGWLGDLLDYVYQNPNVIQAAPNDSLACAVGGWLTARLAYRYPSVTQGQNVLLDDHPSVTQAGYPLAYAGQDGWLTMQQDGPPAQGDWDEWVEQSWPSALGHAEWVLVMAYRSK